jgi:hypothetical protein
MSIPFRSRGRPMDELSRETRASEALLLGALAIAVTISFVGLAIS